MLKKILNRIILPFISNTFSFVINRFPVSIAVRVKENINKVTELDYKKKHILIHADTQIDLVRSRACLKEPGTVEWIETNIREGDVFYDIGANVGAYALIASKINNNHITVYAFEPSFSTYAKLVDNIILNNCHENIFPYLIPLSKESRPSVFHYQSLKAGSSLHAVDSNIDYKGKSFAPVFQSRVITFSIDSLVKDYNFLPPDHIKIDVDGAELDILEGARKTLAGPSVKTVIVEICLENDKSARINTLLEDLGFKIEKKYRHYPENAGVEPMIYDCVFRKGLK